MEELHGARVYPNFLNELNVEDFQVDPPRLSDHSRSGEQIDLPVAAEQLARGSSYHSQPGRSGPADHTVENCPTLVNRFEAEDDVDSLSVRL